MPIIAYKLAESLKHHNCQSCGIPFLSTRKNAKYCSNSHKTLAHLYPEKMMYPKNDIPLENPINFSKITELTAQVKENEKLNLEFELLKQDLNDKEKKIIELQKIIEKLKNVSKKEKNEIKKIKEEADEVVITETTTALKQESIENKKDETEEWQKKLIYLDLICINQLDKNLTIIPYNVVYNLFPDQIIESEPDNIKTINFIITREAFSKIFQLKKIKTKDN